MKLLLGDCLDRLKELPDNSVDSIITDPPYGLSFMLQKWDYDVPSVEIWKECLRVLKPGGHLLSFGGSRTYHRMAVNVEDGGFEIRDQIQWIYGSGFPKSHNIGKAVDKRGGEIIGWFGEWLKKWRIENNIPQSKIAELFPSKTGGLTGCVSNWELGNNLPTNEQFNKICETFNLPFKSLEEAEREFIGMKVSGIGKAFTKDGWGSGKDEVEITKGNSEWEGWGTALKPAHEPIVMARKPLSEKTIVENVLKHGTGGINIDESRITYQQEENINFDRPRVREKKDDWVYGLGTKWDDPSVKEYNQEGRFPANIILSEEAAENLDQHTGILKGDSPNRKPRNGGHRKEYVGTENNEKLKDVISDKKFTDKGGASRYFYVVKPSKKEKDFGMMGEEKKMIYRATKNGTGEVSKGMERFETSRKNNHPTIKPIKLMEYLIKMITPKGGVVLDPFMGSGTTGIAALTNGYDFIGIEMEQEYMDIAKQRIDAWTNNIQTKLEI